MFLLWCYVVKKKSSTNEKSYTIFEVKVVNFTYLRVFFKMIQRNAMYIFIYGSALHHSFLYYIFPGKHPSHICLICSETIDPKLRFLFHCPAKAHFWKSLIFEFLWPTVTIPAIIEAIYTMNFYNIRYSQKSKALSYMIVNIAMADICERLIFCRFLTNPFSGYICISQHPPRHPLTDWRRWGSLTFIVLYLYYYFILFYFILFYFTFEDFLFLFFSRPVDRISCKIFFSPPLESVLPTALYTEQIIIKKEPFMIDSLKNNTQTIVYASASS
jgi:hypothetical protein